MLDNITGEVIMEVQLQELVEKIKRDGVNQAEAQAKDIVSEAEQKATSIIKNAQEQADEIIAKSKELASKNEAAAVSAIKQAGRNLVLTFKDSVIAYIDSLIQTETQKAYNENVIKTLIPQVVQAWVAQLHSNDIDVLLSSSDFDTLKSSILQKFKDDLAKGIEVKADKSIGAGFKIGTKDGAAYYDFTAEAVASMFADYLNPSVAEILQAAVKEQ